MTIEKLVFVALHLLFGALAASLASCEQAATPSTKATGAKQTMARASEAAKDTSIPKSLEPRSLSPTGARVELRDCTCVLIGDNTYELSVKYRFTQGHPDPNREYRLSFQIVGLGEMWSKAIDGSVLADEGELHLEYRIADGALRIGRPSSQVTMSFSEESSRDGRRTNYLGISDEVTGTFIDN